METEKQDPKEIAHQIMQKSKSKTAEKSVKNGRITLYVLGGLFTIVGFLEGFGPLGNMMLAAYIDWGIAAAFVALGFWAKHNPFTALLLGLILYISIHILLAVIDPSTLVRGIIWKILFVTLLVKGVLDTQHLRKRANNQELLDDELLS